jgi:hypothetical protein
MAASVILCHLVFLNACLFTCYDREWVVMETTTQSKDMAVVAMDTVDNRIRMEVCMGVRMHQLMDQTVMTTISSSL